MDMNFNEIELIAKFIERLIDEFKLNQFTSTPENTDDCVQTAFDLFGKDNVRTI